MSDSDLTISIGADVGAAVQGADQARTAIAAITPAVTALVQAFAALGKSIQGGVGQAGQAWAAFEAQRVQAASNAQATITNGERRAAETTRREWSRIVDPIVASWGTAITRMIEGTETFRQAIGHIAEAVLQTFVRAIEQMVEQWILKLLVGKAAQQSSTLSQIVALAGLAGAGGVASMSAAPFPIDLGAPAFGSAMASAALAFASFSAAGGFDVPAGVNPITQLHAQEMVLPAHLANPMRDLLAGVGGRGAGAGPGGGETHLHFAPTINAPPSASLRQMLVDQGSDMIAFVQGAVRDGSLRL